MSKGVTHIELVRMLERLLQDVDSHSSDYHHVTPEALLEEARALLRRCRADQPDGGGTRPEPDTGETLSQDPKGRP